MIEVFNAVSQRIIKGTMFHAQMSDLFDFLGMRGLKRWHEYRFIEENAELRGIHRYAINHLNRLINVENVQVDKHIPSSWFGASRLSVDSSTRKQAVREAFDRWYNWEYETKMFYEKQFKILTEAGKIAEANKINELIKCVDKELKQVTRKMLEYKAVDYDISYIMFQQDEMHECYKEKEKEVGVDIC